MNYYIYLCLFIANQCIINSMKTIITTTISPNYTKLIHDIVYGIHDDMYYYANRHDVLYNRNCMLHDLHENTNTTDRELYYNEFIDATDILNDMLLEVL